MTTALLLPILIGVGGMAVDFTNVMQQKSDLQALADAATLSAASKMSKDDITEEEAKKMAEDYMIGQYLAELQASGATEEEMAEAREKLKQNTSAEAKTEALGGSSKGFKVTITSKREIPLSGLTQVLGFKTVPVTIVSVANSARDGNAISMYMALDRSGSMAWDTTTVNVTAPTKTVVGWHSCSTGSCWGEYKTTNYVTKIEALKTAAGVMFGELLKSAAPNVTNISLQEQEAKKLIRVGAVSYNHDAQPEQKPEWGTTKASEYVMNLPSVPSGGTDATGALNIAFAALKSTNPNETNQHEAKKNYSFSRFVVLMTDGEMTGNDWRWNQRIDEKVRSQCEEIKADGITIFTVAFMAPDRGKSLLKTCASGESSYYESNNMTELVKAFGEIGQKAGKTAVRLTN